MEICFILPPSMDTTIQSKAIKGDDNFFSLSLMILLQTMINLVDHNGDTFRPNAELYLGWRSSE